MSDPDQPARALLPTIEAVQPEQAAAFRVLRRPLISGDRFPDNACDGLVGGRIGELGLNVELARSVTTPIGDVWVIPGNGWLALYVGGVVATPTGVVVRQGTVTWTSEAGKGIVHGLVPDGVDEVTLIDSAEATVRVAVDDNVYGTRLDRPFRSLRFTGPTGEISLGPWR